MKPTTALIGRIVVSAMVSLVGSASALAATFVYVSNAGDGDISTFRLQELGWTAGWRAREGRRHGHCPWL
ncbi:MAG TPA: hypothetical protein PLW68_13525 [Casimicrobiaceae bacterium]|nr:hypothetical protein [Casimicrobiaceae bacterium]